MQTAWQGEPADLLVALHARKSAPSIEQWRAAGRPGAVVLVLTGTDLYRDLDTDARAQAALAGADHVVVLQPEALQRLPPAARAKAVVIEQSAPAVQAVRGSTLVAVGHLRPEKDPATLLAALCRLGDLPGLQVEHIGAALDPALGALATRTMAECPGYRWRGALPHAETLAAIAAARALLHPSRMEGGAHVVIEAVCAGVPVIASRIDGNVGLLGRDHAGLVPVGDVPAWADAIRRAVTDDAWLATLRAQGAACAPRFTPAREEAAVRALFRRALARA